MNVLVLGASGFIGRNLVHYLVSEGKCKKIRCVDKVLLQTAFLSKEHAASFENPVVEFRQGNLCSAASIEKCFTLEDGKFNYVFNCAAETKYGQTEEVYAEKIFDLSVKCATEAAKRGVDKFIELSTGQVYDASSKASKEDGKTGPWTNLAKFKLKAEESLKAIAGLNLIIVRPAIVYGPGDINGLMPRVICGRIYKKLDETMKFLWTESLRINSVHVRDVAAALWAIAEKGKVGEIYNLADKSETDQESLNKILSEIYGIKTGFQGSIMSNLAKMKLKSVTEMVNDKHLPPWSEICKAAGVENTPLTPYLDQELLYNNSLSIDGSKVESLGFTYKHPQVTKELILESIQYWIDQNLFPKD